MSKRRILTIINIVLSIILIVGVILPITEVNLFGFKNINFLSPYIMIVLAILSLIVNALNKKVELSYITSGFTFLYMLDFGWQVYDGFNIGFYTLLLSSFIMLIVTLLYGVFDEPEKKQKTPNNVRAYYDNINRYQGVQMSQNMNVPYQNQMMYPSNRNYKR